MRLDDWLSWQKSHGRRRKTLLEKLLRDNEPLVQANATRFLQNTKLHADLLRDDVFQAARIGLLRAIEKFDGGPGGGFRSLAWFEMRYEMQRVMKDALPISQPRDVVFAKSYEHAHATFYALHGRDPEPGEVQVTEFIGRRPPRVPARFVSVRKAEGVADEDAPDLEGDLDRKRDEATLTLWLSKQTTKDQKEFWTGKRPDLTDRARRFVEARRVAKPRRTVKP